MRRVYIVPRGRVNQKALDRAKELNCPEVANGIPPALEYKYSNRDLPVVHIEHDWREGLTPTLIGRLQLIANRFSNNGNNGV